MIKTRFTRLKLNSQHKISFQGNLKFENLLIDLKMIMSAFPGGLYNTILTFSTKTDDNLLTLKHTQEMVSKDRNEFK